MDAGKRTKRNMHPDGRRQDAQSRKTEAGVWRRLMFFWLNPTFHYGYSNLSQLKNLPSLDNSLKSDVLHNKFLDAWSKVNKSEASCLMRACLFCFLGPFFAPVIPMLLVSVTSLAQPYLLQRLLESFENDTLTNQMIITLVGTTIYVFVLQAICKAVSTCLMHRCAMMLRGAMKNAIYEKTMRLNPDKAQEATASSVMSTDTEGLDAIVTNFHNIWLRVMQVAIGTYMLFRYVGMSAFFAALPSLASILVTIPIVNRINYASAKWKEKTATRVHSLSHIATQIKGLRMSGLGPAVTRDLSTLRLKEAQASKASHLLQSFTQLVSPLALLPIELPDLYASFACLERIQEYLLLDERQDKRAIGSTERDRDTLPFNTTPDVTAKKVHFLPNKLKEYSIELKNASISPSEDAKPLLRNVDLAVNKGEIAVVVGPIGGGKTLLLEAIIGEVSNVSGTLFTEDDRIAYSSQTPWLQNLSIRQNIVGPGPFDFEWYQSCIQACLLHTDLQRLPGGDTYVVGSEGIAISGGQRQRIALARALYARHPITVLDSPLNALDRRTAKLVFYNIFGKKHGIIRKFNTTVVVASHKSRFINIADTYIVVNGRGSAIQCADRRAVINACRALPNYRLVLQPVLSEEEEEESRQHQKYLRNIRYSTDTRIGPKSICTERLVQDNNLYNSTVSSFIAGSISKRAALVFISLTILSAGLEKLIELYISVWLGLDPNLKVYILGYPILIGMHTIIHVTTLLFFRQKIVPDMALNMHQVVLNIYMNAKLSELATTDAAIALSRFSHELGIVDQTLPRAVFLAIYWSVLMIITLSIVVSGVRYASLLIPFLLLGIYLLQTFYLQKSRQLRQIDAKSKDALLAHFAESRTGLRHIRSFGWQCQFAAQNQQKLDDYQQPHHLVMATRAWLTLIFDLIVVVVIVLLTTLTLLLHHLTTSDTFGLTLLHTLYLSQMMQNNVRSWLHLETALQAVNQLQAFARGTPTEVMPDKAARYPRHWPSSGHIVLQDVNAKYSNDGSTILKGLTCSIFPGARVAITGRTGSGKSSFVLTLLHFLDHTGYLTVDGIGTGEVAPQLIRSRVTTVSQDTVNLRGSVRYNLVPSDLLAPGTEDVHAATDASLTHVLTELGLWKHIKPLGGLNAEYDSLGLSHGQKQLFCIARAMIHHDVCGGKLVVMDEATSHLDPAAEMRLQSVLKRAFNGATIVCITHRKGNFVSPDYIFHFEDGVMSSTCCTRRAKSYTAQNQADIREKAAKMAERQRIEENFIKENPEVEKIAPGSTSLTDIDSSSMSGSG